MSEDLAKSKEEFLHIICGLNEEQYKLAVNPQLVDFILSDLEKRVKRDNPVKLSVLFTGISGFLKEPINLFQKGESGIGKSYNTVQTLKYFPKETTILLGGLSPKALIHDYGVLLTEDGKPADTIEAPEKPRKSDFADAEDFKDETRLYKKKFKEYIEIMKKTYTLIELSGKTLVFLENPDWETFHMLYPILSHDTERIEYRFVDKLAKGQMRTMHVVIQGWPATVFLTVDRRYMEELATRSFTVTPESTKEKIADANQLTNMKANYPWLYDRETGEIQEIRTVVIAIRTWFKASEADVVVPFEGLYEFFPKEIVRDMRDFQHFTQFLKAITALHLFQRPLITINGKSFVVSTMFDVAVAINIYREIFETTRTGTEQAILDFYHNVIKQKNSWYLKDLTEEYNVTATRKASSDTIRIKLDRLAQIGYVNIERDENNKTRNIYTPLHQELNAQSLVENHRKTPTQQDLKVKLKEGFEKWKNNILVLGEANIKKFFHGAIEEGISKPPLTLSDLEADVLDENFFSVFTLFKKEYLSKAEPSLKQENKPESLRETISQQVSNSDSPLHLTDISQFKSLVRLTTYFDGVCEGCGFKGRMDYQITMLDDSWGLLCEKCGRELEKQLGKVD